jgi:hypothetical protein
MALPIAGRMTYRRVTMNKARIGRLAMTMPAASSVHWLALEL